MRFIIIIFLTLVAGSLTHAKSASVKKPNVKIRRPSSLTFTPGEYKLVEGKANLCGDGTFGWPKEGTYLSFGILHGFNSVKNIETLPSDIPEEKGCNYDVEELVDDHKGYSVLTFKEVLRCKSHIKHVLVKKATIHPKRISMTYDQTGAENSKYKCRWALKK